MRIIDEHSAEDYLRETGHIDSGEPLRVRELAGGVSNMVLLVERLARPGENFVLKQARPRLRTEQAWYSNVERNWREADVLRACTRLLAASPATTARAISTPRIVFEDRDNYLFAMTAAPEPLAVWKHELLAGRVDHDIAAACGQLLAALHAGSWGDSQLERQLGDCTLFDQLRVDPYYRTLAEARPEAREAIGRVIGSLAEHRRSLVHADFSPKNLLVFERGLMMVDFETGHYGDPAFDLGFFSSHLVLKACHQIPRHDAYLELSETFWREYARGMAARVAGDEWAQLEARGVQHFAACAWARLDGKSPVDYLADPARRDLVRSLCREVLAARPGAWSDVAALCRRRFQSVPSSGNMQPS